MKNKTLKMIKYRLRTASQWLLIGLLTTSTALPGIVTTVTASTEEHNVSQPIETNTDINTNEEVKQDDNTEPLEVSDIPEEVGDDAGEEKEVTTDPVQITPEETSSDEITSENNSKAEGDIDYGIFGTSEWRLDSEGTLHIGAGEFAAGHFGGNSWTGSDNFKLTKKIVFEGKVIANPDSSSLFAQIDVNEIENLPYLDTSNVTDMSKMFSYTYYLKSLDLSSFDTSQVTNMSQMFYYAKGLESLDVSSFNTSSVTDMSTMFCGINVTSLDVSNFDTSNVTNMSSMFSSLSSVASLDISTLDTSNVIDMSFMFSSMNVETINVSTLDTSNVTKMDNMFGWMRQLKALDISNFDTSKVTSMSEIFTYDSQLSQLTLGKNFNFVGNGRLPEIGAYNGYTGKWINIGSGSLEFPEGKNIWSSAELMTNYIGDMDADTYIWQRQPVAGKDVTVKYEDESGKSIADEETLQGKVGENYNSVQKDIEGYTFKEVKDDNASGKFTDQAQTVIYVYTKNPVAGKNVTVKYENESGKSIADEETLQGKVGEDYNSVQKDIEGYTFKEVKDDNASGKFTDQAQTVIYIYTKNPVSEEDLSHITVHDSDLKVGDNWTPEDNFDEATDFEGKVEKFSDIIVEGSVDTKKAGTYEVTYSIPEEHWSKSSSVEGVHSATAKIVVSEEDTETDGSGSDSNNSGSSDKGSSSDNGVLLTNVQNNQEQIKQKNQILPQTGEHFSAIAFMAGLSLLVLGSLFAVLRFKKNK
ncbi:MucBP domain-containing protein [Lactococcus garvieae]|uniref:MucBP domain-containing protein n=1 Tax=Lactococcus garvieae TaxID=1363 RepID=UPI0022E6526E|nr:MucBP domain-containing protein [Lactococcus garvieae]